MKTTIIGVDVDTQFDFCEEGGSLYVPADPAVKKNLGAISQKLKYVIGSVDNHGPDAWEFQDNGGPFPRHCEKGTAGALKIRETVRPNTRFIPMSRTGQSLIGENVKAAGVREFGPDQFVEELLKKNHTLLFEKEVYSLFNNPNATPMITKLVEAVGGTRQALFAVYGYCTGGYCVDAAAQELARQGLPTAIILDATAPLNFEADPEGHTGLDRTLAMAQKENIQIITTEQLLATINQ